MLPMSELDKPHGFCAPAPYYITHYLLLYISGLNLQLVYLLHPGPIIPNSNGGGGGGTALIL